MGSTRYIMSPGELTRKDNSLCFRKDGKNVYIPIENTKEIVHDIWELFKVTDEYLQGGNCSLVGAYKISIA